MVRTSAWLVSCTWLALYFAVGGLARAYDSTQPTQPATHHSRDSRNQETDKGSHSQKDTAKRQRISGNSVALAPASRAIDQQRKAYAEEQEGAEASSQVWSFLGIRIKPVNALMAASTFALFIATAWLVWITREGSRRQLRAYVLVEGCKLTKGKDDSPVVRLVTKNFGQTPAHDVVTWVGTRVDEHPLQSELPDPGDAVRAHPSIIGPGSFQESFVPVTRQNWAQWELIRAKEGAVYVWGRVKYTDAFRKKRTTRFRLMLQGDHAIDNGRFGNCEEGNYAD